MERAGADMYRDHILDHYKNPRNHGEIPGAPIQYREDNPLCGDDIEMHIVPDAAGRVADVKFHGQGCAISTASASLLTESVKGQPLERLLALGEKDVLGLLKVPVSPVRMKCAMLALSVLQNGIRQHQRDRA